MSNCSHSQTFLPATTHLPTPQPRSLIKSPNLAQQAPPEAHSPDNGARICECHHGLSGARLRGRYTVITGGDARKEWVRNPFERTKLEEDGWDTHRMWLCGEESFRSLIRNSRFNLVPKEKQVVKGRKKNPPPDATFAGVKLAAMWRKTPEPKCSQVSLSS